MYGDGIAQALMLDPGSTAETETKNCQVLKHRQFWDWQPSNDRAYLSQPKPSTKISQKYLRKTAFPTFSIQGNSGPMVLHKCLALATCIHSKSI